MSDTLKTILKTAIQVEINGYTAFQRMARETEDDNGRRMFHQLAQDEIEHRELLEKQLAHLEAGGVLTVVHIPPSRIEKLIPAIREKQQRTKGGSGLGETDALKTALDLERKAADFFREKAAEVDAPEAREMFIRLAEWEDSHFELIQAELDHINQSGLWFGLPEFRMDGTF